MVSKKGRYKLSKTVSILAYVAKRELDKRLSHDACYLSPNKRKILLDVYMYIKI